MVKFQGEDITGFKPHQLCRKGMARIFQLVRPFLDETVLRNVAVANAYSKLKWISTQLMHFIRAMGYPAMYRETLGWAPEMIVVPTAGIGEFARNGRVISPEFGINMRLKPVTTDLPLEVDKRFALGTNLKEVFMTW